MDDGRGKNALETLWSLPTRSKALIAGIFIVAIFVSSNADALGLRGGCSRTDRDSYSVSSSSSSSSPSGSSSSSSSSSSKKYTGPTAKATAVRQYIYSSEMENLRHVLHYASDGLMDVLGSGNASEIESRSASVTNALRDFRALDAPSECASLRDSYIQAANHTIYGLDAMYEALTIGENRTSAIDKATKNFGLATASVSDALTEFDRLKKTF